jgi:PAS domain S-box-containing protein
VKAKSEHATDSPFHAQNGTMARDHAALSLEALSPEATRRMLLQLHDHQAELELQNEELLLAKAELAASRALYRDLYDLAPVGYCTVGCDGHILQANLTVANLLGVGPEALVGKPLERFIHDDDRALYASHHHALVATREPRSCELRVVRSDGTQLWAYLEASATADEDGRPRFRLLLSDVTQRRLLQLESEHERSVLEVLARSQPLADVLTNVLLQYEARFPGMRASLLVLDPDGRHLRHGAAPRLPAAYCAAIDGVEIGPNVGSCGTAAYTSAPAMVADIESDPRWRAYKDLALSHGLRACWSMPILAASGRVLGTFAFYFGAPRAASAGELATLVRGAQLASLALERHLAEAALVESERRFRTMIEWMPEATAVHRDGKMIYVNPAAIRSLGATRADALVGRHVLDFVSPELRQTMESRLRSIAEDGGDTPLGELTLLDVNGAEMVVEAHGISVAFDGGPAILVAWHDITARKKAEQERVQLEAQLQQATKMQSVGRLAGGVAHDFNNQLVVVLGHVDLALEQLEPSHPIRADLVAIREAATRSADLTRQLLAFARKQTVAPKVLDLNVTVTGMLKMLSRLLGETVEIRWAPDTKIWPVKVDPCQLDQILTNLCVNARDAIAESGSITIETSNRVIEPEDCAHRADAQAGEYVCLTVRDDGSGITKEALSHIFEPFFTTKALGEGTGLGLATVYGAVTQNQGFIDVSSEPGRGTTFEVHLRAHRNEVEASPPETETETEARAARRGGETVLLVEDEPAILKVTARLLEAQGYAVLRASGATEALRVAAEHAGPIQLLITDVVMPGMNGRDLASALSTKYPLLRRLFMSGYTADVIAHQGVLDEAVSFLQKPFSRVDLAAKVREVLEASPVPLSRA